MKIVISGYGRMGKEVEKVAISKGHQIAAKIDQPSDWLVLKKEIQSAEVVIDFSLPDVVVENIERCLRLKIPIVTGTTGWYDSLPKMSALCEKENGTLFYAPNFSIGVNLFFLINKKLASTMSVFDDYQVAMKEIHHIHKMDAPSGTAINAAEDIIAEHSGIEEWVNQAESQDGQLPIESERIGEIPGTHIVTYFSATDKIELKHEANNRGGFAKGAVKAAEWVVGKKGVYTMSDLLKSEL